LSLASLKFQPVNVSTGKEPDNRPTDLVEVAHVDGFDELFFIL
jgi:hypothetical protein